MEKDIEWYEKEVDQLTTMNQMLKDENINLRNTLDLLEINMESQTRANMNLINRKAKLHPTMKKIQNFQAGIMNC